MAGPFGDTFVETSDTNLASHTPTGANPGTSWNVFIGAIIVDGAQDRAEDNNDTAGNRANLTDAMGTDEFDVQGEFTNPGPFWDLLGPTGRAASAGVIGQYEFVWDSGIGA